MGAERIRFGYPHERPQVLKPTLQDLANIVQGRAMVCPKGHEMIHMKTTNGKRDECYCAVCNVSKPMFNHE